MTDNASGQGSTWDCGWDEHRVRQLRRFAALSFSKKLEWLEHAQELARAIGEAGRAARQANSEQANRTANPSTQAGS